MEPHEDRTRTSLGPAAGPHCLTGWAGHIGTLASAGESQFAMHKRTLRIGGATFLWAFVPSLVIGQSSQAGTIRGRVLDQAGAPVANARVALVGVGRNTYSQDNGRYAFTDLAPRTYVLRAQRLGFAVSNDDSVQVDAGANIEHDITLQAVHIPLSRVVISPGSYTLLEPTGTSQQVLTRDQLLTRPQLAEDLFRGLNRLPGLSGSDYSAKLRIRNGGQDELLVLLDGVELIEPFHLKDFDGALSMLDGEAVGRVEMKTGGFGVQYGNRMTGVIELTSASPDADRARNSLGLSFSNVRARSEGRFAGNRGAWMASARRGYLDLIFKLIGEEDAPDPRYYDVFGKVQYQLNSKHLLSTHALVAGDELHFSEDDGQSVADSHYDNVYLWNTLRSQLSERIGVTTLASFSHLTWIREGRIADFFNGQPLERTRVDDDRGLDAWSLKQDWTFDATPKLSLLAGGELRDEKADYDYFRITRERAFSNGNVVVLDSQLVRVGIKPSGARLSAYGAVRTQPWQRLTLDVGLRADRHGWTDQTTIAPRASLSFDVARRTKLRAAFGIYSQAHTLQDLSVVDGDTVFARAERAEHRVLGVEHELGAGWTVRGEAFQRLLRDPRQRWINTDGEIEMLPETVEDRLRLTPSDGEVRGTEWLLTYDRGGPIRAAWSYVLSKGVATQSGVETPRPFDERHAFAFDLAARSRSGWTWAFAWTLHSGWPFIPATFRVDTISATQRAIRRVPSAPLFAEQLDAYQRFDVRVSRAFDVGRSRISFFAELFNILDTENHRGNSYAVRVVSGEFQIDRFRESFLPRLPSLGVRWEF